MNVMVTGSSGFVGRNLVKRLLKEGHVVYGLDIARMRPEKLPGGNNFREIETDICSLESLKRACGSIRGDIGCVFHTVAIQPSSSKMNLTEYLATNVAGAANLLTACEECGFRKVVASSSFSIYGKPEYLPMDEGHPAQPNNIYGLTKLEAELLFEFFAKKKGFRIVMLRYDGIYGAGQTMPGFIQYLIDSFSKGQDVELFAKGRQKRDNVYVGDVVEANMEAMGILDRGAYAVFNIGGGDPKSSLETAETVRYVLGSEGRIILSEKENLLMGYDVFMDISKAKKILGYNPSGLRRHLSDMIKEARESGKRI